MMKRKRSIVLSIVLLSSIMVIALATAFIVSTQSTGNDTASSPLTKGGTKPESLAARAHGKPSRQGPTQGNSALPLGIDGDPSTSYPNIPWVRLSYTTCGQNYLSGTALQDAIQSYHNQSIKVLLTICQQSSGPQLFDPSPLSDAAQAGADAVQCGNEEMKNDPPATRYVSPQNFARYFDLCQSAMHAVQPNIPVILGSLDPHVGWIDYGQLQQQVRYLDAMQSAMNTSVHPGGHWSWRSQIIGLIDSWHNGYPNPFFSSLTGLFAFWAIQFHINVNSSNLGQHFWVVEGTGCFKQCGLDAKSQRQVAIAHIITLISDVQTTLHFRVPFFYFNGKDFNLNGTLWPMGILDINGNPKPLRQDLPMGARVLTLNCSGNSATVVNQEQLLASLYSGCTLPNNYYRILAS